MRKTESFSRLKNFLWQLKSSFIAYLKHLCIKFSSLAVKYFPGLINYLFALKRIGQVKCVDASSTKIVLKLFSKFWLL